METNCVSLSVGPVTGWDYNQSKEMVWCQHEFKQQRLITGNNWANVPIHVTYFYFTFCMTID